MSDITLSVVIDRTELGLSDLELNGGNYKVAGHNLDLGRITRRRELAESPFVHGAIEVASVKDKTKLAIALEVEGTTMAAVISRLDTVIAAFSQSSYQVIFTIDGAVLTYDCDPADYETGLSTERIAARKTIIVFEAPRAPGVGVGTVA